MLSLVPARLLCRPGPGAIHLVAALILASWAISAGGAIGGNPSEEYAVRIARLKYGGGGDWYSNPSSLPNWLREFEKRTGIKTHPEEKIVGVMDEDLRA